MFITQIWTSSRSIEYNMKAVAQLYRGTEWLCKGKNEGIQLWPFKSDPGISFLDISNEALGSLALGSLKNINKSNFSWPLLGLPEWIATINATG